MKYLALTGAIALAALPSAALAHSEEKPPEAERPSETVSGSEATPSDPALDARGAGRFVYRGSGGITVRAAGVVTVRSAVDTPVTPTAEGFRQQRASKEGTRHRYWGRGTVTVDCSACKVVVRGRYRASVDATEANMAIGMARGRGRGYARLDGGKRFSLRRGKIVLTRGPLDVELMGRRALVERKRGSFERGVRREERPAEGKPRAGKPEGIAEGRDGRRDRPVRRHLRTARWQLAGPASGTVTFDEITGRLRLKDLSSSKDLKVTAPDGTSVETRDDGVTVVTGLVDATGISVTGTAFRMVAKGSEIDGGFLPADGTKATSAVLGRGTFVTPDGEGRAHRRRGTYLLLQGDAAPAPEAPEESKPPEETKPPETPKV